MQSLPDGPVIAGAVTYAGTRTGRIYLTVASCPGCGAIAGTSLASPASFAIRGDDQSNTSTSLIAFMDTLGTGRFNAGADPVGSMSFNFQGSTIDVGDIALTDPTPPTLPQVAIQVVVPSSDSALVIWSPATAGSTQDEIADHYDVYAAQASGGACPTSFGSPVETAVANSLSGALVPSLVGGASYCFAVAAVSGGTAGPISAASGPWSIGATPGGHTVTGRVTFAVPNVPLVIAVAGANGANIHYQRIANPSSPQPFTVTGVPDGTYSVGAFLDTRGGAHIDPLDPSNGLFEGAAPRLTVTADSSIDLTIGAGAGRSRVVTQHSSGGDDLGFDVQPNLRIPVAASILSGPNLATVIDLPLSQDGAGLGTQRGLSSPPLVDDTYGIHVIYADGYTEDIFPAVTGVVAGLAAQDALAPYQTERPSFTWTLPGSLPTPYYEEVSVDANQGNRSWDTELASGSSSAVYDFDGTANPAVLDPATTYQWRVRIIDANGNASEAQQSFTTPPSLSGTGGVVGQVSYAGSNTGRIYVTAASCPGCEGVGTSLAAPGSFAVYGDNPFGTGAVVAFMDVLGTGQYNAAVDPFATTTFTASGSAVNVGTLDLVDPGIQSPGTAGVQAVMPSSDSALVFASFSGSADHLAIYAAAASGSTCPASLGQPVQTIVAQSELPALVTGLTAGGSYCFAAAAIAQGATGALSGVFGPVTIQAPTGGNTLSGKVTFPTTPGAALMVAAVPPNGNGTVYFTRIANPVSPQAYTITGVASGSYQVGAFLDVHGPGHIDMRDPSNGLFDGSAPVIDVSGDLTADVEITSDLGVATATIGHFDDDFGQGYNLDIGVRGNFKVPVKAELFSGPQLGGLVDIGATNQQLRSSASLTGAPAVGDQYAVRVTYDDGSSEVLVAPVTGVLGSFPTLLAPAANSTAQSTLPTFSWSLPAQLPVPYRLRIHVEPGSGGSWIWQQDLASGTTSAAYNADGSASQSPLAPTTAYQWGVQIFDAYGNSAEAQRSFTTP